MASDYDFLPVSNGSGDAPLMHISPARLPGATTLVVDTVTNIPTKFIATAGSLLASGLIDPTTAINFKGHLSGGNIIIDAFEPGSTDVGNTAGQVVIIKPNTGWANRVAQFIKNATNLGTPEAMTAAALSATSLAVSGTQTNAGPTVLNGAVSGTGYSMATMKNPYQFSVYRAAAQNDGGATPAIVQFDTEKFDTGNNFDAVTSHQFVAPINGFYHFTAGVWRNAKVGGTAYLYKNGSTILATGAFNDTSTANALHIIAPPPIQLTAGDTVDVRAGGEVSVRSLTVGPDTCYFGGFLTSAT